MTPRRGSFLVICVVLVTLITILSVSLLHNIVAEIDVSTGNQRYLLCQQAAEAGLDHAVEQILIDYGQKTVTLPRYGNSSVTVPSIQYLDGAYRAPFTAVHRPNSLDSNSDNNAVSSDDDVRTENYVLRPWAWWWFDVYGNWSTGLLEYDGRGRYYEPGFYNVTPTSVGSTTPVLATPFTQLSSLAVPERSQGMFYDEQFRRVVPSGDPLADRAQARYRLRYTVGVEDLSGHLLINPIADMQMLAGGTQAVDYRTPAVAYPWMTLATNTIWNIAGQNDGAMFGAQLTHVFQGRGYHINVDFDHTPGGLSGYPKTFPLEYRAHPEPGYQTPGDGGWETFHDGYNNGGLTHQFYYTANGRVTGRAAGGETIPLWCSSQDGSGVYPYADSTISHCLMGPMLSPQECIYAAHGETGYLGPEGTGGSGQPRPWDCFAVTPFGRPTVAATYTPGHRKWYEGRVSTPFCINIMTAPPAIIQEMLLAAIPPQDKSIHYVMLNWYLAGSQIPAQSNPIDIVVNVFGHDLWCDASSPAFGLWPAPSRTDPPAPSASSSLSSLSPDEFNPPAQQGIQQVISPDYYCVDTRLLRSPAVWPYPGPLMEGSSAVTGQGGDTLGAAMDETSLVNSWDFYTQQRFFYLPGGPSSFYYQQPQGSQLRPDPSEMASAEAFAGNIPAPQGWGMTDQDVVVKEISSLPQLNKNSYWLDLMCGLGTAIGVLRAEYLQYQLPSGAPATHCFGKGSAATLTDPDPSRFTSLRDLDRVFLAEMGESLTAPGSGTPAQLHAAGNLLAYQFHGSGGYPGWPAITPDYVPRNNIFSLVQVNLIANNDNSVTSATRAKVMELMLNDFRMSFLGSSPDYSDGIDPSTGAVNPALAFKPLDFRGSLGDGNTYCSCYYPNLDPVSHLPCAPDGTPPPQYFTVTGNFFMGKSHFYRIFSRGELWDNLLQATLNTATLDSAIAVDPEGTNPLDTQMLYQRWVYDRYYANLSHVQR